MTPKDIDPETLLPAFERDGYVVRRPLLGKEEIRALNQEIERFIREIVPTMPPERIYYEDRRRKSSLKQLQKMFEYDPYFERMMFDGPVRRIAEILLKDDVTPINMQYFNKPAGIGKPTPPHQDGYYFHLTPCKAVTGWLALEDVDDENGCIHYVRGSHKAQGFREHGQTGVLGFSQGIIDFPTQADEAEIVSFPGKAGTFLMHDAKTIHWAGANRSGTRSRKALGFIYYARSAKVDATASEDYQRRLDERLKSVEKI